MRALFYNHSGRASGAERVLLLALQHLDRASVDPYVVCPDGQLAHEVESLCIPVGRIGELRARFTILPHMLAVYALSLIRTGLSLRREVRRSGADIVHANSPRAGIAALFATVGTGLPVIWHVHDELQPHPITTIIRLLARYSTRCSVVAVSRATAVNFAGGSNCLSTKVSVIHNAVDIAAIDGQQPAGSIRQELELRDSDFLFGIVGQITPRKGQLELVRAFAKAAVKVPNAKLLVVGSPIFDHDEVYRRAVIDLTHSLGITDRVLFLGHRSDAARVIKQLDALIINSKSEALVMVALEGMACRTPIIATDVGGTNEMIEDGLNGRLIRSGDLEALVAALVEVAGDKHLRGQFVRLSRIKVEESFNVNRFIDEFHGALLTHVKKATDGCPSILGPVNSIESP